MNLPAGRDVENNSNKKGRELSPWTSYSRTWGKIFLASCVIAVSIDPLFLYIPVINEEKKCLAIDETMKTVALFLRSLTDFTYLLHLVFRLKYSIGMARAFHLSLFSGFPWSYLLIDILAILPIPQVIILSHFSKISGSRSLTSRKVMNILLLLQYIPRILRVYLSAKELARSFDSLARRMWTRGLFNFFLYILVGHLFGGFWYFYSIYRETACWHLACKSYKGCVPSPFDCRRNIPLNNLTFLSDFCPTNPPKQEVYDFGIFSDAIGSRIVESKTKFLDKFCSCFWWGLKNMSSFGSNLNTSKNIEENLFAALISVLGLFMFLYLIGNLQTYMQLSTVKAETIMEKINTKRPDIQSYLSSHDLPKPKMKLIMEYLNRTMKHDKDIDVKQLLSLLEEDIQNAHHNHHKQSNKAFALWVKKLLDTEREEQNSKDITALLWMDKNNIQKDLKSKIMRYVKLKLREGKDFDVVNLLSILPSNLVIPIKKHLCFRILKKVPMLANLDEGAVEIYRYLTPMTFPERSDIIRKGEPLDLMLFITQGYVWSFGGVDASHSARNRLEAGDYYGDDLLQWILEKNKRHVPPGESKSVLYRDFPVSTRSLKSNTKVEAFAILANDLENLLVEFWYKFRPNTEYARQASMPFAAMSLQGQYRRQAARKRDRLNQSQSQNQS